MKRLHVHVAVEDLTASVQFYSTLFGAEPTVSETDYAKWMLDDPCVNFAISTRGRAPGLDHLGIQVDSDAELAEVAGRLAAAQRPMVTQEEITCCYARGNKAWVADPQGTLWETFHTVGGSPVYGEETLDVDALAPAPDASSCCAPSCCAPAE